MALQKTDTAPDNKYAVEVEDLTVAYNIKPVLWDIDLKIPKGSLMAVIGPNGAGKTTLIKAILDIIPKVSGSVKFFGQEHVQRNTIAYVPQSGSVDWDFPTTVLDVVTMGRYASLGWFKRPGRKDRQLAIEALQKVDMQDFKVRQISELSGGQQQRVFLARALAQDASIYFMDEPFKGVDAKTEQTIVEQLKDLKHNGKTVIVVHHDLRSAPAYFDYVAFINMKLVACGTMDECFNQENIDRAYQTACDLAKGAVGL